MATVKGTMRALQELYQRVLEGWHRYSTRITRFALLRWVGSGCLLVISLSAGVWFVSTLISAFKAHNPENLSCARGAGVVNGNLTYLQIDIRDQNPTEPYFSGALFGNLGNTAGTNPRHFSFVRSALRGFGSSTVEADLYYDPKAGLWFTKPVDVDFIRLSGTHRDFPFDSASFDFDISSDPAFSVSNFILRNRNPSFDVVCSTFSVLQEKPNLVHLSFEVRRNPLVQLTAVVLVGAGFLFLIAIVMFVKKEALPTSIASFFFSLWSIRAILSSEMKTFPTVLDLAILSLCVLLLVLLGLRLALFDVRALWPENKEAQ